MPITAHQDVIYQIYLRKNWLEQFESQVLFFVFGPCSSEERNQALRLHEKTVALHRMFAKLELYIAAFMDEVEYNLEESEEFTELLVDEFHNLQRYREWRID